MLGTYHNLLRKWSHP
ncbi:hypothetical protein [Variovorax terrae]|uniref:PKHD-type hydroxylase C-terminal domain-containing protein n=1 Tax=Variovorax terrae TaxID=2923278 RepID=A0A9X1VX90_9BURK|nr:hypothetical protein [Variovorax terrae]